MILKTNISTGRRGKRTPNGTFSAGPYKARMHRSNLYDDAPMPWSVPGNRRHLYPRLLERSRCASVARLHPSPYRWREPGAVLLQMGRSGHTRRSDRALVRVTHQEHCSHEAVAPQNQSEAERIGVDQK